MTNAEKFKEVFGIKIDENVPEDPCAMFDHNICIDHECGDCPACHFWEKEYKLPESETKDDNQRNNRLA